MWIVISILFYINSVIRIISFCLSENSTFQTIIEFYLKKEKNLTDNFYLNKSENYDDKDMIRRLRVILLESFIHQDILKIDETEMLSFTKNIHKTKFDRM